MSVPFEERGGTLRGCFDLVSGRYPRFVFGGRVGDLLPVFHFHDEARDDLSAKLQYLVDNGYRTVTADEIGAFVRGTGALGDRRVALCFDDAWTSVWTMAGPLLKEHGLTAIVYAIPGRTADADACRPQGNADGPIPGSPFMTWPELRALQAEGTIDVQSHTHAHANVFSSTRVVDFVRPEYELSGILGRPLVTATPSLRFVQPEELGAPLFDWRSRMSDGPRVRHTVQAHEACVRLVAAEGNAAFFTRPNWRSSLTAVAGRHAPDAALETADEQQRAIDEQLDRGRSELNHRLATRSVNHVCLPWGVSGARTAEALRRLGFGTAIANRLPGIFAVRRGDDPHWLKRLHNRYIFRLPGRGRRWSLASVTR